MGEDHSERIRLKRGQALHFHASKGTTIASRQGTIHILPAPLWVGEQMVQERFAVHGEGAHRLQQTGMVAILAQSDTEVICMPARARLSQCVSALYARLSARIERSRLREFISARTGFR